MGMLRHPPVVVLCTAVRQPTLTRIAHPSNVKSMRAPSSCTQAPGNLFPVVLPGAARSGDQITLADHDDARAGIGERAEGAHDCAIHGATTRRCFGLEACSLRAHETCSARSARRDRP